MDLDLALSIMRTGDGHIRPIIDHYAKTKNEDELIPYLSDADVGPSILYILSELPKVSTRVVSEIERLSDLGAIGQSGKAWADEIVFNHS